MVSVTRTDDATSCLLVGNGTCSRRLSLPLRQTLKCFAYGNSIYREKDLRDDGGVLQRPRGEGSRPEAQERRRADGKVAHGRGGLRAVEDQPRTLQTLRDRRLIGYSQINRRFYYKPEEVKRLIPLVGTLYPGGK